MVAKRLEANELVVAFESERADPIWHDEIDLHQISWMTNNPPVGQKALQVKVRYRDPRVEATFVSQGRESGKLIFKEPQRALASGQICALYEDERVLGGAVYL